MRIRKVRKDKHGLVAQIQSDGSFEGGDSACWTGHYAYLSGQFPNYVKTFERRLGGYVRHPVPEATIDGFGAYYRNPWDGVVSRDQLTGILMGVLAEGNKAAALRIMLHSLAWAGLFTYNTRKNGRKPSKTPWKLPDFLPPSTWQIAIRVLCQGNKPLAVLLYPVLLLCDLNLLVDTFLVNRSDKDDVINYLGRLFASQQVAPTFLGRLCLKMAHWPRLKSALNHYWCNWRNNPGMYDLFVAKMNTLK